MADSQRKTGNLFPLDATKLHVGRIENDGTIDYEVGTITVGTDSVTYEANTAWRGFYTDFIQVNENEKLTFSPNNISYMSWNCTCYDGNDNFLGHPSSQSTPSTITFTLLTRTKKVRINVTSSNTTYTVLRPMLNTGSVPLPYEPYGWVHSLRKLATATDTFTTLPADIYADGNNATVGISGNMEQNGTPTPDNPIQPQETGDRTANLFDKNTITPDKFVATGGEISSTNYYCSDYIPVSEGAYYLANVVGGSVQQGYVVYDSNKQAIRQGTISGGKSASGVVNISANEYYIRINMHIETSPDVVMVNSGSTALPYEPFGYEIPISSANTTTPVYLGEVQTTRKIGKIDLGTLNWSKTQSGNFWVDTLISNCRIIGNTSIGNAICTHFTEVSSNAVASTPYSFSSCLNTQARPFVNKTGFENLTAEEFKQAMSGVYMYYVLATEETGIVNEPLRKIGDYADTVSGITIPTIAGANTISVDTQVQPSEVTVNYKGWHPVADVHEADNGAWT